MAYAPVPVLNTVTEKAGVRPLNTVLSCVCRLEAKVPKGTQIACAPPYVTWKLPEMVLDTDAADVVMTCAVAVGGLRKCD